MNPLKEKLKNYHIILGSQSPRRKQLLSGLGVNFDVIVKDVDETYSGSLSNEDIAIYIARKKALEFTNEINNPETIVITADSIVCIDSVILGKPADAGEAIKMIKLLSGRKHDVITGVCIVSKEKTVSFYSKTVVSFKPLSDDEVNYYVEQYKPFDKAGAYGIQEWLGYIGVDSLSGSYTNVMGLPTNELYEHLMRF